MSCVHTIAASRGRIKKSRSRDACAHLFPPPRKRGRGTARKGGGGGVGVNATQAFQLCLAPELVLQRQRSGDSDVPSTTLPPSRSALRRTRTRRSSRSERRRVARTLPASRGRIKKSRSRDAMRPSFSSPAKAGEGDRPQGRWRGRGRQRHASFPALPCARACSVTTTKRQFRCPLHRASRGSPPPLRGGG